MENGKHNAVSNAATVYTKDDKLICAMEFLVGAENEPVKNRFVLVKDDGTANEECIKGIREWSGWDGIDPYWLKENAPNQWPVEVVIKWEPGFKDPSKSFPNIKWVNAVGGSGMQESDDRGAILARFGSALRAVAGPRPVPNARHTPVKQTPTPSANPPSRPAGPTAAPVRLPTSKPAMQTQTSCWEALGKGKPNATNEERTGIWFTLIGDRDQNDMTGADWAVMAEAIERMSDKPADADEALPF